MQNGLFRFTIPPKSNATIPHECSNPGHNSTRRMTEIHHMQLLEQPPEGARLLWLQVMSYSSLMYVEYFKTLRSGGR